MILFPFLLWSLALKQYFLFLVFLLLCFFLSIKLLPWDLKAHALLVVSRAAIKPTPHHTREITTGEKLNTESWRTYRYPQHLLTSIFIFPNRQPFLHYTKGNFHFSFRFADWLLSHFWQPAAMCSHKQTYKHRDAHYGDVCRRDTPCILNKPWTSFCWLHCTFAVAFGFSAAHVISGTFCTDSASGNRKMAFTMH